MRPNDPDAADSWVNCCIVGQRLNSPVSSDALDAIFRARIFSWILCRGSRQMQPKCGRGDAAGAQWTEWSALALQVFRSRPPHSQSHTAHWCQVHPTHRQSRQRDAPSS